VSRDDEARTTPWWIEPSAPLVLQATLKPTVLIREVNTMRKVIVAAAIMSGWFVSGANAQVELKTYADKNGYIDVQALTCAQLAGTFQEDADLLTTWYSGWYNGLGKKHFINIARSKEVEHETIVYCKANPDVKIIKAIGLVFDRMRKEKGIVLAK
jgi:HdeA/HdeB family